MVFVDVLADSKFPISRPGVRKAIEEQLLSRNVTSDVSVSVLVCGIRKSAEIAKKYLGDSEAHDVLSFPLSLAGEKLFSPTGKNGRRFLENPNEPLALGDIVVCYQLAQEEANEDNMMVDDKISELVKHGVLHLLGEHHEE
jgi:probable rRNA maturation factor